MFRRRWNFADFFVSEQGDKTPKDNTRCVWCFAHQHSSYIVVMHIIKPFVSLLEIILFCFGIKAIHCVRNTNVTYWVDFDLLGPLDPLILSPSRAWVLSLDTVKSLIKQNQVVPSLPHNDLHAIGWGLNPTMATISLVAHGPFRRSALTLWTHCLSRHLISLQSQEAKPWLDPGKILTY